MIKTNFNPYAEALYKTYRATGDYQEMPLSNGRNLVTQVDENGNNRLVMGPVIYLPRVTLTEWFWSGFPNGSIIDELVKRDENQTIVKVTLASDRSSGAVISSSYGIVTKGKQDPDEIEKDPYSLAYYIALEGAMQKAGFLISFDADTLIEEVPGFKEKCHAGELYCDGKICGASIDTKVSEPSEEQIAMEEKIKTLEELARPANESSDKDIIDGIIKNIKPVPKEKLEEMLEEERKNYSKDPIEEALPFVPIDTEDNFKVISDEPSELISNGDSGDMIVSIGKNASQKLLAYDGKRVKDLPEAFLKYAASKNDWNGLIDNASLAAIRDYAAF